MAKRKNNDLERELELLLEEVNTVGPMMRGSITIMGKKNKQPYFSVGIKGKTRITYLGDKRAQIARIYTENYKKMLGIVEKMTVINMTLLKSVETK
jgi:hypothetical protein